MVSGLLSSIFGSEGLAVGFFGGNWWLVGLFLIFIMSVYLYINGGNSAAIAFFIFASILFVTIDNLFDIPSDWIMVIIVFILILIGTSFKQFISEP